MGTGLGMGMGMGTCMGRSAGMCAGMGMGKGMGKVMGKVMGLGMGKGMDIGTGTGMGRGEGGQASFLHSQAGITQLSQSTSCLGHVGNMLFSARLEHKQLYTPTSIMRILYSVITHRMAT
jgi:hypothetical protein